ncbi:WXG100 family type VII secretion target [Streptomyces platensis]|uniref:WXG100 family type VII secretion target n=1 Tax=Streptomyces platensis TaxID=58346 RepID=UPI00386433E6|nr:type VII secretion target [Streptomyces platensis]
MMNFKVDPDHIAGFGKLVGRAADDMRSANSYIDKNTQLGGSASSFIWDVIGGSHDQTVSDAKTTIKGFAEILDASEKELTRSAKYYRSTDQQQAAKIDGTYKSPGSAREWDDADADLGTVNPSDFTDRDSPTGRLKSTDVDENYFQE